LIAKHQQKEKQIIGQLKQRLDHASRLASNEAQAVQQEVAHKATMHSVCLLLQKADIAFVIPQDYVHMLTWAGIELKKALQATRRWGAEHNLPAKAGVVIC
jgi:hypothetical protein